MIFLVQTIMVFKAIDEDGTPKSKDAFLTMWALNFICFVIFINLLIKIRQIEIKMNKVGLDEKQLAKKYFAFRW